MQVLSTMARIVLQVAIVLVVPGGLPAVLIYQYRRLQQRRRDALLSRTQRPLPTTPTERPAIPESPR